MEKLFLTVLGMSGAASVAILIVALIRLALRRAPKIFSYALWAVVLLRLLCPFTIESAFSLIPDLRGELQAADQVSMTTIWTTPTPVTPPADTPSPGVPSQPVAAPSTPVQTPVDNLPAAPAPFDWLGLGWKLWLAGLAGLLGWSTLSLLKLRQTLAEAVPLEGETGVQLADRIPSPFVLGLVRPKIYLPSSLPEHERDYILLHERTHIRRGDHILQALAWLAVAVHWFNPLVWLAFRLAGKDMEMSCDEAVLRRMGRDVRADYSASLLRLSAGGRLPAGPLAFGDSDPKSRIKNVLNYKKPALWVLVVAVVAVAVSCVVLATSRRTEVNLETPTAEVWVDYSPKDMPWGDYEEIQLPEFPGVTFRWQPGSMQAISVDHDVILSGQLYFGMPIDNVFLCDLTGDGNREFCSTVCWGSGLIDNHIVVYDYANHREYTLWDRGEYDYTLSLEDGQLMVTKSKYPDLEEVLSTGRLIFTEDGRLAIEGDPVDNTAALPIQPNYQLSEYDSVQITGLGGGYAEWHPGSSRALSYLYFAGDPSFFCYRLAGRTAEGSANWSLDDDDVVTVSLNIGDERVESGSVDGFSLQFDVNVENGVVTKKEFQSLVEGETLELKNSEMVAAARTLANLLWWSESYYYDQTGPVPAPEIDLSAASYALNDLGTTIDITGLDCEYAWWRPRELNASYSTPDNPLGHLEINRPRFLGENLADFYNAALAVYSPDDPNLLWMHLYGRGDVSDVTCTVNLLSGSMTGDTPMLTREEMLTAARAMRQLILEASDCYTAATNVHEEGPLPFDAPMKLWFGSGAGGWSTILTLHPDGRFKGDYTDADMEIQYVCQFHGTFTDITQVTDASWSMTLETLELDTKYPVGREWDEDGYHYISSEPYGFDDLDGKALQPGAAFTFYTPNASGKRGGELYGIENESSPLYQFWTWWPNRYAISGGSGGTLKCYALHNITSGRGFFDLYAWGLL